MPSKRILATRKVNPNVLVKQPYQRGFWQRTIYVFITTALVGILIVTLLYSRSFSLGMEQTKNGGHQSVAARLLTDVLQQRAGDDNGTHDGSALFKVVEPSQAAAPGDTTEQGSQFPGNNGTTVDNSTSIDSAAGESTDATATQAEDPPELQRAFRLAEQALEFDDPQQAMESLLILAQTHPEYHPAEVSELLYRAYLAVGDLAMRDDQRTNAIAFYARADQLAVIDTSALARRQQAIERFFPSAASSQTPESGIADVAPPQTTAVVPIVPVAAQPTTEAIVKPLRVPVQCPDDHIAITAPAVNETVSGYVTMMGSAGLEDLWFYKLEWAPVGSAEFAYFGGNDQNMETGALGTLDTRILENGQYILRVTVVDESGNYPPPCDVPVTVRN